MLPNQRSTRVSEFSLLDPRQHDRDIVYPVEANGGMPSLTTILIWLLAAALVITHFG